MFFQNFVPLTAAIVLITSCTASGAAVSVSGDRESGWELSGKAIRIALTAKGDIRTLERLAAGDRPVPGEKPEWRLNLPKNGFWSIVRDKETFNLSQADLLDSTPFEDKDGSGIRFSYTFKKPGIDVTLTYRIASNEADRLRVSYVLEHHSGKMEGLRFNLAFIGNLEASSSAWFVLPYRSGKLMRTDAIEKHSETPSPGHLWMQWTGYYDGKGNGVLTYPEDKTGFLKFAQYGPGKTFRMGWSESVVLIPGHRYEIPYEYVIRPLATPDTFNDLANAYAEYARRQPWMNPSLEEKIKARPELERVIREGVVKFVGFGALNIVENGKRVFKPREEKEKMAAPHHTFERAIEEARSLESLYTIKPAYRYDGWWGRFDAEYPFVFPISERLGGDKKLEWFQSENRKDGRYILFHLNPIQYDWEKKSFKMEQMVKQANGEPLQPDVWAGNKLYLASPKFALPDMLTTLGRLSGVSAGAGGVFWDVIGAMSPYNDFNPNAGYTQPGRDAFYQEVLKLFGGLREAEPTMVYGTEDGQEQMLPYFDWAPNHRSYGDEKRVSWAPLVELVYGDRFANVVGIDGNNRTYNDSLRVVRALYGASLGHDARGEWVRQFNPVVQQIFELNRLFAPAAVTKMQKHTIDPAGWRASIWPGQVVVASTATNEVLPSVKIETPLGTLEVEGIRPNGFVVLTKENHWALWGARKMRLDGKVIASVSNADSILICNDRGLTLTSYDFRNRENGNEPSQKGCDLADWTLSGSALPARWEKEMKTWPGKELVEVHGTEPTMGFAAPGESQVYRSF